MEQAEINENLPVCLREQIAGVMDVEQRQQQDPKDMTDSVDLEVVFLGISKAKRQTAVPGEVQERRGKQQGNCLFDSRDHVLIEPFLLCPWPQDHLVFHAVALVIGHDVLRAHIGYHDMGSLSEVSRKPKRVPRMG